MRTTAWGFRAPAVLAALVGVLVGVLVLGNSGGLFAKGRVRRAPAGDESAGIQGGTKTAPGFIAADRTPFPVGISMRGLRAGGRYSIKIRLRSAEKSQFGATWNAVTGRWAAVSSSWSSQTTVTPGSDGGLTTWLVARAGSRSTTAGAGPAEVGVVLRGEGASENLDAPVALGTTVLPISGAGRAGWFHGTAPARIGPDGEQRVSVRDSSQRIVGLAEIEPNNVDDDDDGVVDDEATAGAQGPHSFRVAVPAGCLLDVSTDVTHTWADQVAFGGLDLLVPRQGIRTLLGMVSDRRIVDWPGVARLGIVLHEATDETVTVQRSSDGLRWSRLAEVRTRGDETVTCRLVPHSVFTYRAVWLGTPQRPPAVSSAVCIRVRPLMLARLGRTRSAVGRPVRVSGALRPAGDRIVWIVARRMGVPARSGIVRTSARGGKFGCLLRLRRPGRYAVSSLFRGDRQLLPRSVRAGVLVVTR